MRLLHFKGRALKPYAEAVSEKDLKEGAVYFMVNYVDEAMLMPTIQTVVFVGRSLDPDHAGEVYFQDLESYRMGIRYGSEQWDMPARFFSGPKAQTSHIFEFEQALEELMKCSLRRKAHSNASS